MSLLMDALKKAEQEKKEAAKRLEDAKDNAALPAGEERPAPDPTGEHEIVEQSRRQPGAGSAMELTLAPIEHGAERAAQPAETAVSPPGSEEPTLNRFHSELEVEEKPAPEDADQVKEITPVSGTPVKADLTFHGVDMDELKAESGLFEETVQGEPFQPGEATPSYDETLPGVPAAQLAKDIGGKDQPTPVAAETIFSATQSNKRSSLPFKLGLIASCVLLVVAASVGYFYWVTPVTPRVPSPWVARGIESVTSPSVHTPAQPAAQTTTPNTVSPPATSSVKPAATTAIAMSAAPTSAPGKASGETATKSSAQPPAAGSAAETPQGKSETSQTASITPVVAPPRSIPKSETATANPETSANGRPPAQIQFPASAIHISHSKGPSQSGMTVKQAYDDYLAGRYKDARSKYLQVLGNDPGDRDAMLGVAAIDVKSGDLHNAVKWYSEVLSADPRNPYARAGLIAMGHTGAPQQSESAVKSMLRDEPDNSFLYFILGNIYAGERNWAQAQQAFFDAYRNDSSSADYAMNLAVSLDHLGQRQTALDYYNVALKLAGKGNASFDPNAVLARIRQLKGQSSQ